MAKKRRLPIKKRRPPNTPQWSMLPKDLIGLILARLDLVAHVCFGSVCSWWRSAALENPPINKPLALVLSKNPDRLVRGLLTSIRPSWAKAKFIGCLEEWLVVLIDGKELFIFNAASGEQIPLPPPPDPHDSIKAVLSSPPSSGGANCTIVLRLLSYCKLGDESFTKFYPPQGKTDLICDIVIYKEKLYAGVGSSNKLEVFDLGFNSAPTKLALPTSLDGCGALDIIMVVSCDKLLAVYCAFGHPNYPINVFELDLSDSKWVEVGGLGDNMVLIGGVCSLSFSAIGYQDLRENHVYYSDPSSLESLFLDDKVYMSDKCRNPSLVFFDLFQRNGFKQS